MSSDLNAYLNALRSAVRAEDPGLAEDAVWDARTHVERELKRLAWEAPALSTGEALDQVLGSLGTPEAAAARYLERDTVGRQAPRAQRTAAYDRTDPGTPPRPWPTFFGIFSDVKTYTALLYLLLAMITAPLYWTWVWMGLSVSFGLLILVVGFPLLALALGSFRALGAGEAYLASALLDTPPLRPRPVLPSGRTFTERLKHLFFDGHTWRCTLYLLSHLPLAIVGFTLVISLLAISGALTVAPLLALWDANHGHRLLLELGADQTCRVSTPLALLLSVVGLLGLTGTLHLTLGLGRLHGHWARWMLR